MITLSRNFCAYPEHAYAIAALNLLIVFPALDTCCYEWLSMYNYKAKCFTYVQVS